MRTLLLALTTCSLILSATTTGAEANGFVGPVGTSEYCFVADQSIILQTGGFAGVRWTYHVAGRFRLMVNRDIGTASLCRVEATATDDSPDQRTLDPNEVFNLTGLAGTVVDETTIRFEGKADDGSSILITLTFADGTVALKGETTPPPNSADFFVFTLDAVAQLQCTRGPDDSCLTKATQQFVFIDANSTILQTGGIAGVHWTYHIEGRFRLTVNLDTGTASFSRVDANATDDSPYQRTLDPNQVFNLTALAGTIAEDGQSIRFEGKAHDGSSVLITATFVDGTVTLKGETTPPPHSADFFVFTLDAVAERQYAGGTGEPNDPYQIATAADLIILGETPADYDKHFVLTADIDLDPNLPGRKVFDKAVIAPRWRSDGDESLYGSPFFGAFDGNDHTISHLTINGADYLGLFGHVVWGLAQVKNLGVVDVNVTGSGYWVGGLVGSNGTTFEEEGGILSGCYSTGVVRGDCYVGGLVGVNCGSIATSFANGTVSGRDFVGGLVGDHYGGSIAASHSRGSVSGTYHVGGLAGENGAPYSMSTIATSYSAGSVSGTSGVGGLVGGNCGGIYTSYSTGSVSGTTNVGGLAGYNDGYVTASFWDIQTSGQDVSVAGIGKTTAEMQTAATFLDAGWDLVGETANGTEDIWWILEGRDYPRLWWERVLGDDFEDGEAEPLWMLYQPQPESVQLKEINGRLEVEAVAQSENVDAIYVPNGWRLDATKDFALRVDFHFSKQGMGDGRVTLGVVPSLDPGGMRWAELEAGCLDMSPFFLYEVQDGPETWERQAARFADNGTLYLSYNPAADELYFSYTGYGKPNAWQTAPGLLKGRWASRPVYVILSGGSEGMAVEAGDAWLDNFVLNTGVVQSVEPPVLPDPAGAGPVDESE